MAVCDNNPTYCPKYIATYQWIIKIPRVVPKKHPESIKHQKFRAGSCMVHEWLNYPHGSSHLGCRVSCQGVLNPTGIVALPVLHQGQSDHGETCIMQKADRPLP